MSSYSNRGQHNGPHNGREYDVPDDVLAARADGRAMSPQAPPARRYSGSMTTKTQNAQLRGQMHPVRMQAVSEIARLAELELVGISKMPDDGNKLALLVILEMMMNERPTVAARGREAYLKLKGLLLSKGDEKKMRKANGMDAGAGLM